ncbi:SusD/RagB family nutrient-binding outer membrane lipoprotein [Marinifilum fragile]|uniref:SusD/RagB family nutrient-binding outer membrane lipoprotein n=2 Tax=Marinifilum fragile TaxID=570161 RepID=UPI002AA65C6C|nr:SusD/RagB family nutrient-binding outer membrane lipoprotein [Marinifilum fragile]
MKKYIYKFGILLFSLAVISACSGFDDDLEERNTDTKNASEVPPGPLFTNAVLDYYYLMLNTNVNSNVFRLYSQYWAQTTYPDESQYNQTTRNIGRNMWRTLYRDVLKDLDGAKVSINNAVLPGVNPVSEEAIRDNKLACIKIIEVLAYSNLVDLFGDVPYTDALDIENPEPSYDDAATVYSNILTELDNAIDMISTGYGGLDANDPIYGGNMSNWLKYANSLKLRLALRLADVNPSVAQATAEEAISNTLISSNADNFKIDYMPLSPNTNPLWVDLVQSGRKDFVAANHLVDYMNAQNDPRRSVYFTLYDGSYKGGIYGTANSYSKNSHIGDLFHDPELEGVLMSYAEVEFLLAEAAERGYTVTGTAEDHYNAAVLASMAEWGVDGTEASTFLAQPEVAYTTATGDWKVKIGSQKWISLFNNGFEGWTTYRLLDFGILKGFPIFDDDDNLIGYEDPEVPVRFLYPIEEATLNGTEYDAAAAAIGGDEMDTKLFWDIN